MTQIKLPPINPGRFNATVSIDVPLQRTNSGGGKAWYFNASLGYGTDNNVVSIVDDVANHMRTGLRI